ncbi:hypothetical protein D3C71_1104420 [compost metagenome]
MRIEQVGHALQVQGVEVERLQRAIRLGGVVGEVFGEGGGALLQRGQQLVGEGFEHRVRHRVRLVQRHPGAAHLVQRLLHRRVLRSGGAAAGLGQGGGVQLGGEHLAAALHQVVRLVHQQRRAPLVGLGQAVQQTAQVKVVVVVAHHHIGPAGQLLAQVVGADVVLQGDLTHTGLQQGWGGTAFAHGGHGCCARGRQPVVKAPGQRARLPVTGLVRVFTGLVARHQLQHAQGQRRCAVGQARQRIQRHLPPRGFGGQKEHLVDVLRWRCLEQWEQRAHGLANARGRLGQQAAARHCRLVNGLGQRALAGAKVAKRKRQRGQCRIARGTVGHLLFGPGNEALALGLEVLAQVVGATTLGEHRLLLRAHVLINQRHVDVRQLLLLAQQPAIHLGLRPVQVAVRCGLAVQPPLEGLDLVDALLRGVVAIGPAAHAQALVTAAQCHLGAVACTPARRCHRMARYALQRGGCGRKAQVQVALFGGELAQLAHRHGVGHGGVVGVSVAGGAGSPKWV